MTLFNKLRERRQDHEIKTILNNFFSLSLIQGTNFILPLIVLPYLVKVIGIDKFGLVSFAQALMSYFIIFTDYGFNLTATREIALYRNDHEKLLSIVNKTLLTKIFLCAVSFIVLLFIVSFVPYFSAHAKMYYMAFLLVIGQVLIPSWFFQGIEQMKYLTYINLIAKLIFTALIFFLITQPGDFIYVPLFYSLGNIISGIIALGIMYRQFNMRMQYPVAFTLRGELRKGWNVFVSNFAINGYISSNLFILGLYANNVVLGYYSIADKILYVFRQILNVFFNTTYPQACQKARIGFTEMRKFYKKYFYSFCTLMVILCATLFLLAEPITVFFAKEAVPETILAIRLLSFVPVIICFNIPAFQVLLAYNFQKNYMIVLVGGSLLNIVLNLLLAPALSMIGTTISIIITEIFITAGLYIALTLIHKKQSITTLTNSEAL